MSTSAVRAGLLALALTPPAFAQMQEQFGFLDNTDTTYVVRLDLLANEVVALFRRDDYQGWSPARGMPGQHNFSAFRVFIQDQDGGTPEVLGVNLYTENPALPHQPNFAAPIAQFANIMLSPQVPVPGMPAGYDLTLNFGPMGQNAPSTADFFVGYDLQPTTNNDGLHLAVIVGEDTLSPQFPNWDIGNNRVAETGHGLGTGGYAFYLNPTQGFWGHDQVQMTVLSATAGFSVAATTNQARYPSSTTPPGTTSFFSGLQPAMVTDRLGAARSDNVSLIYQNANFTSSEPVFFLLGLTGFAANPVPYAAFFPNATGVLCIDLTLNPIVVATQQIAPLPPPSPPIGQASFQLDPGAARSSLLGQSLTWTAILVDVANLTIHGGPCGRQNY
jgi:hypothetical protein